MTDPEMALKGPNSKAQGASPGTCSRMESSPERAAQADCAALSGLCLSLQPIPRARALGFAIPPFQGFLFCTTSVSDPGIVKLWESSRQSREFILKNYIFWRILLVESQFL
jgi:hypothetical protein